MKATYPKRGRGISQSVEGRPTGIQHGRPTAGRGRKKAGYQSLGSCIYAARVGDTDTILIGYSTELYGALRAARIRYAAGQPIHLLGARPGTKDELPALVAPLARHRQTMPRNRTRYDAHPDVLAFAAALRTDLEARVTPR